MQERYDEFKMTSENLFYHFYLFISHEFDEKYPERLLTKLTMTSLTTLKQQENMKNCLMTFNSRFGCLLQ